MSTEEKEVTTPVKVVDMDSPIDVDPRLIISNSNIINSPNRRTSFRDMLVNKLANMTKHITRTRKRDESLAKCLFEHKDVVDTVNPLARFFRMMCIDDNISKEMFFDMHREHLEQLGLTPNLINIDKHNLIKALVKPSITMDVLSKTTEILGYTVLDMTYTVLDKHTGEVKTYSINHIPSDVETNPNASYAISNSNN